MNESGNANISAGQTTLLILLTLINFINNFIVVDVVVIFYMHPGRVV